VRSPRPTCCGYEALRSTSGVLIELWQSSLAHECALQPLHRRARPVSDQCLTRPIRDAGVPLLIELSDALDDVTVNPAERRWPTNFQRHQGQRPDRLPDAVSVAVARPWSVQRSPLIPPPPRMRRLYRWRGGGAAGLAHRSCAHCFHRGNHRPWGVKRGHRAPRSGGDSSAKVRSALVVRGSPDEHRPIAPPISYTREDHQKSIFDKTGVQGRH
jgi:hypothetical protein